MPLDRQTLLDLQADSFAEDVAIDEERMRHWSQSEVEVYFESGGETLPRWDGGSPIVARKLGEPLPPTKAQEKPPPAAPSPPAEPPPAPPAPPASAASSTSKKPRILCLHGSASNAEATMFQMMILGLYELDGPASVCDCIFLEGPHISPHSFDPKLNGEARSWHAGHAPFDSGLRHVVAHIAEKGPYDGVYGFSQGCCMVAMLSDPEVWKSLGGSATTPPWRFVIMGCGTDYLLSYGDAPKTKHLLTVPSLHIMGRRDGILHDSRSLAKRFEKPLELMHEGGHAMPMSLHDGSATNLQFLKRIHDFVEDHGARVELS